MIRTAVRGLRLWLIGATVLGIAALFFSLALMAMSPMIFDSGETQAKWNIFIFIWTMPFVLLLGLIVGWIGYALDSRIAVLTGLVLWAIPLVLALFSLAIALVWGSSRAANLRKQVAPPMFKMGLPRVPS